MKSTGKVIQEKEKQEMIDIRKITNGYWWNAQGKFKSLINGEDKLKELTMQITDKCNKACPKCNKTNFTFQDMEYKDIIRILLQASDLGLTHIHFTGGEPTMHSNFLDIVRLCKDLKLRIDMSTNGKFDYYYAKELVRSGMDSINISWDFINEKPDCLCFIQDLDVPCFINHMVMPSNYLELEKFLVVVKNEYPSIVDIQLMPPRGTADKFNLDQIDYFNKIIAPVCFEFSNRFPMVAYKIKSMLPESSVKGIYHIPIKWPCHRSKSELRVGTKGFTTCTYLYRDGHTSCGLETSVKDAWEQCKRECRVSSPKPEMCEYSCSPEVTNFNYFVEKELNTNEEALAEIREAIRISDIRIAAAQKLLQNGTTILAATGCADRPIEKVRINGSFDIDIMPKLFGILKNYNKEDNHEV